MTDCWERRKDHSKMYHIMWQRSFLSKWWYLQRWKKHIVIYQAKDDCNTLIVRTAINLIKSLNYPFVVVTQDTDILVLICCHQLSSSSNMYFQSDLHDLYDKSSIDISNREEFIFMYGWSGKTLCYAFMYIQNVQSANVFTVSKGNIDLDRLPPIVLQLIGRG